MSWRATNLGLHVFGRDTRCSFCHRVSHAEGVCETKRAAQLATPNLCSVLAQTSVDTHCEPSNTLHHPQSTPPTVPTVSPASMPPQNTRYSCNPEGDPEGDLHEAKEGSDCDSSCWVASQSTLHAESLHIPLRCPTSSRQAQGGPRSLPTQGCSVYALWPACRNVWWTQGNFH